MNDVLTQRRANCENCHKCVRYCPVKSIRFVDKQAKIINEECILCGNCVDACPQHAKIVRDDLTDVIGAIGEGRQVIASVDPSFISEFHVAGIDMMGSYLKQLGFSEVRETAEGAYLVKTEYERMIEEDKPDVLISSCCDTVVRLIQKYHPQALPYLAPVLSPMLASGQKIRAEFPGACVVYIGPCLARKDEAQKYPGFVDWVLTFEELKKWFRQKGIQVETCEVKKTDGRMSRLFARTGGVVACMSRKLEQNGYQYVAVDGMRNCISAIREIKEGNMQRCFVEMYACEGGCINGSMCKAFSESLLKSKMRVDIYARPDKTQERDFEFPACYPMARMIRNEEIRRQEPPEEAIQEIMRQMGKTLPRHVLNCGSCGYPTCREKAIAVYNGKADVTMCLPFLLAKTKSFSDNVFNISPNAILVLDDKLKIQRMNMPALHMFHVRDMEFCVGREVSRLMDPTEFKQVLESGNDIIDKKLYLEEYNKYVELTVVLDSEHQLLFGIFKDITLEHDQHEKYKERRARTIDITDKVIEKQMRIVQEIASLLGETTAETKVALSQIKTTVLSEDD